MKALSIRQPYAWLIVSGIKTLENRTWRTDYRGPLLIHAGLRIDEAMIRHILRQCRSVGEPITRDEMSEMRIGGAVVGVVDLVDCTQSPTGEDAQWHNPGAWAWILRNPRQISPIPARGRLGLFDLDITPPINIKKL